MFSRQANYSKLKTNLRLVINRLKLLEKKKTELALKARKEIADYIQAGKEDRARIRVEHIIREDYMVEAMEMIEMYCDLLLARFGLISSQKDLDAGLEEAVATLIWVTPRLQADVAEFKPVAEQLTLKYSKEFAQACLSNQMSNVSEKVMHKLSVQAPPKILVERYLVEIAKSYNVPFTPDPNVMNDDALDQGNLIDVDPGYKKGGGSGNGSVGGGGGGGGSLPYVPVSTPGGVSGLPYPPVPTMPQAQYPPPPPTGPDFGHSAPANAAAGGGASVGQGATGGGEFSKSAIPPADYGRPPADFGQPPPYQPTGGSTLPDLPAVPGSPASSAPPPGAGAASEDVDFDDLTRRFEDLKRRK